LAFHNKGWCEDDLQVVMEIACYGFFCFSVREGARIERLIGIGADPLNSEMQYCDQSNPTGLFGVMDVFRRSFF
jgi:hypothetical protein